MNLKESQDRIQTLMTKFVTEIEVAKAMDNTDINRKSEDALIPLLSEIYEHTELKNLNVSEGSNFPGIDLGDKKARIAYQITSRADSKKVKDTLKKFVERKLYEKYDRLVIYILKKKQKTYQGRGFDEIIQDKFTFDKGRDILDYRDLLKEISGFSLDKLRVIESILEEHFGDPEYTRPLDPLDWLEKVNNLWGEEPATIKINREKLRNDLQDFALRGSGVVIGSPGVGKTYLLKELRQSLKSDGIPHLLLPIGQLGDETDENLPRELFHEEDLIARLKSVPVSDQKGILLFDAFDAARNEQTRKRFLRLIRRAIQNLKQWNVVVTVRTYDAEKSQEFLDLFGNLDNADLIQYHSKEVLCRHFEIPSLNKDEIRQAFDQIPYLESVYNDGSPEFKQLLANPFNLWLLEKMPKSPQDVRALSQIHSEVQLLDVFWRQRVAPVSNKVHCLPILTQIVQQMAKDHSLTVRLDNISDNLGLDQSVREAAWDYLFSNEVLVWTTSTGQRIAFSHNILFDYAISVLLIEDEPQQLEDFVRDDSSRPLFLRPSLTYFFTRLWYNVPERFWDAFWHILPKDQPVHLRLFARLVPTSVIASETCKIDQLKPLSDKLGNGKDIASEAMSYLLQSLRAMQIKRDPLWIDFFDQISAHFHPNFAWELTTLTSEMLERAIKDEDTDIIDACGRVGRRLLAWIWQERETSENDWYNRLGGYWIVPLVAKTYGTKGEESQKLLEKVPKLMKEDNFPIEFLTRLTEHIDKIWDHDPEFVGSIYRETFAYHETDDELLNKGSLILGFGSTRRQDYRMCQYQLVEHFPNFLQAAPLYATQAVIESLNFCIIRTHVFSYRQPLEDLEVTFNFRGKLAYFVGDSSYIWGQTWEELRYTDEPIEMADALFELIKELAIREDPLLDSLLDIFRDYVRTTFFWKGLLKTAAQFPGVFAPRLFELCIAKPILMGNAAFYELCAFLEAAAAEFTSDQLRQIEQSILRLPKQAADADHREFLEQRRNQLLAQIPLNLLHTDAAKTIREQMERENDVPVNRPPISFKIRKEPVTEEKRLQERGVDTNSPKNQELHRFFKPLDKFSSDWRNDMPTAESIRLIFPQLERVYTTVKRDTGADKEVIDSLWYKLTDCAAILARIADNSESHLFVFCRQVLLHGAKHELPKPNPELDTQFDHLGYSPFPRHEAARGLLRLTARQSDEEMLDAIETLARDPVPSVRMVTAMELFRIYCTKPDRFWRIMDNRATSETNQVVQKCLYATLTHVVVENEEKTTHVMDKLLKRIPPPTERLEAVDPFIDLLVWLAIDRENSWALKAIENTFFKDPIRFANPLRHAVFRVMEDYVVPKNIETEQAKRAIEWLSEVIDVVSDGIKELCTILKEPRNEEVNQQLHDVYGVVDQVIRHLNLEVVRGEGESEEAAEEISNKLRCCFYNEVKPLMEQVIDFALDPESGVMLAQTAHYFMELLTSFLSCNPKEILGLAGGVVKSSERFGYNLDSLAVKDVVKLVEIVLADHRNEVRDGEGLDDLLNLLDIFAKAGWPDALRLVWRLDEVFR